MHAPSLPKLRLLPRLTIALLVACLAFVALAAHTTPALSQEKSMSTTPPSQTPARIARWFGGKKAALSLRFDDSNPTHISVAVPLLNEFGLIGTFLVTPGNRSYQDNVAVWEGPVLQRGHELGDHTMNHHGAKTDAEAEEQVGKAAEHLRSLQPQYKLITFEPGGATLWLQRKPFAALDAKYHLVDFNAPESHGRNVMSCSEVYSFFSVDAFEQRLEKIIAEGDWFQPHFHQIDETGHLRITPPVFRQILEVANAHRDDVWQAGMNAIYQYDEERNRAALFVHAAGDDALVVDLACSTDARQFTQPLTLEIDVRQGAATVTVTDEPGKTVPSRVEGRIARFDVAPTDATYMVRAAGIGAAYRKDHPAELAAPGPHPYLFFTAADLPALMTKTGDPTASLIWQRIVRNADELANEAPNFDPQGGRGRWQRPSRLQLLAFAYALTGNPAYAKRVIPEVEWLVKDESWHVDHSEALVMAGTMSTLGIIYDCMHDAMPETLRGQVRQLIVEQGIRPVLATVGEREWWTSWYRCNWGAVIYGQVGVAALSILGESPEAEGFVRLAQRKLWHYTHSIEDDGGWGESGSYGSYAWSNAMLFLDALKNVTAGKVDLFDAPNLRKLPQWFLNTYQPDLARFVPFADCTQGGSASSVLFRLGREYRDGYAQWAARKVVERGSADPLSFIWYDPTLESKSLTELPVTTLFPALSWAFLRNRWEDPEAILFGLKGGTCEWDHHHHDGNAFVLYAYGEPLLVDFFYPRSSTWGITAEAHNTVVVNGKDQLGHVKIAGGRGNPDHRTVISDLVEAPWYARLVGDASMAYDPADVRSFIREVMYLRKVGEAAPPDYFLVFDDVDASKAMPMDVLLHTYGEVKENQDTITVTQGAAAADITTIAPAKLAHEIRKMTFDEAGVEQPRGIDSITMLKVRPAEPVQRGFFLSVIAPRRASESPSLAVTPIREANVLGVTVTSGGTTDVALFALDAPEMASAGVTATGRSCFVRKSGGAVTAAALNRGQRLSVDGSLLFETNSWGHAVLEFGGAETKATLNLYDSNAISIHAAASPAKVFVNSQERKFEYDEQAKCVRIKQSGVRDVRIVF